MEYSQQSFPCLNFWNTLINRKGLGANPNNPFLEINFHTLQVILTAFESSIQFIIQTAMYFFFYEKTKLKMVQV